MSRAIVITGGSKGIGAATARRLAKGSMIFINYAHSDEAARKVAADVADAGGTAHLVKADVSTEEGCRDLVRQVAEKTDKIDVLFNNAGALIKRQSVEDFEWDFMVQTFSLNTFSTMMLSSLFLPLLRKSERANIVNVTSIALRRGSATASIYSASKGAIDAFTRGIAAELAPDIRVNAVAPGVIVTPFHDQVSTPEQFDQWAEATPLKRNGAPDDIAKAVEFIIDNDFLCGETIDVNGGLRMR